MLRFLSIALVALALGAPAQGGEGIFLSRQVILPARRLSAGGDTPRGGQSVGARPKLCGHPIQSKKQIMSPDSNCIKTKESDYIRRPLRVTVQNRDEVQFLNSIGMDIWEVKENYVFGAGDGLCD